MRGLYLQETLLAKPEADAAVQRIDYLGYHRISGRRLPYCGMCGWRCKPGRRKQRAIIQTVQSKAAHKQISVFTTASWFSHSKRLAQLSPSTLNQCAYLRILR